MNIAFPFCVDGRGRVGAADDSAHVRELMEQLIFTAPGERINRPELGSGLAQLVFAPASDEIATATEYVVQSALQRHLGDVIQVEKVNVVAVDETLTITVTYVLRKAQERQTATFTREV